MATRKAGTEKVALSWSVGVLAGGVAFFIIGSILKSHFAFNAAVCNTYGTSIGGSATHCAGNEGALELGQFLQPIGGIMVAGGLIALIVLFASLSKSTGSNAAKGVVASSAQGASMASQINDQEQAFNSRYGSASPAPPGGASGRNDTLYGPSRISPKQLPLRSDQEWRALTNAVATLPDAERDNGGELASLMSSKLGHKTDLRAPLFASNRGGGITLLLLFDDRILLAKQSTHGEPNITYIYETGDRLPVVVRAANGQNRKEISLDKKTAGSEAASALWLEVLSNEATLEHFCTEARTRHWLVVVEQTASIPATSANVHPAVATLGPSALSHDVPPSPPQSEFAPASSGPAPVGTTGDHLSAVREQLAALKELFEQELISEVEYTQRKGAILDKLT